MKLLLACLCCLFLIGCTVRVYHPTQKTVVVPSKKDTKLRSNVVRALNQ